MRGIIAYGAYVPYNRLQRDKITQTLGSGGGRGTRSVASYDEDTTSMGVEAARIALAGAPGIAPGSLYLASANPAYLDKTNANTVHAALGLSTATPAIDMMGSARSASGALGAALFGTRSTMVVSSDVRTGLPASTDESAGGDGAAAFLIGDDADGPVLAEFIGGASATAEFLDRWRSPGDNSSRVWEERFGEAAYLPLVEDAVARAYEGAGLTPEDVDKVVLTGMQARAVRGAAKFIGVAPDKFADDLTGTIGNTGAAHPGTVLAHALDGAGPGEVIMTVDLADGATAGFYRTTDAIAAYSPATTVQSQIDAGNDSLEYAMFLTWREMLVREPPRRPDPDRPAAPPSERASTWKYGFVGSECTACQARHLPPSRVCVKCESVDQMIDVPLSDVPATIATYTIDRLAFSLSPPVVAAVIDFDGGGRFAGEMTDVDPDSVAIGDRVQMTFRRLFTAQGVHNYFWKARPARS